MNRESRAVLVHKWVRELALHLGRSEAELLERGLDAADFKGEVSLGFEDGSRVYFRYAFCVRSEADPEQVAVFTEHCGYHEFFAGPDDELTLK
jgi:hypothetical protein